MSSGRFEVPARQPHAADEELSSYPDRHGLAAVEQVDPEIGDRPADRCRPQPGLRSQIQEVTSIAASVGP